MAADDLSAPLGRGPISKRLKLPVAPATLLAGALGLVLAVFVGWVIFVSDPQGGEPSATVVLTPSWSPRPAKTERRRRRRECQAGR